MKYSIAGMFGVFALFITLVISGSKLYAEDTEKESGWAIGADNKKYYMSLTGHIPQNIVRAGAQKAQRCSISSGKGEKGRRKGDQDIRRVCYGYRT